MLKRSVITKNLFGPDPKLIFNRFDDNTNKLQHLLSQSEDLTEIVAGFINENSPFFTTFSEDFKKSVEMMRLSAASRKFTLTPLIAEYTDESKDTHHLAKLIDENDDIDHVFVNPQYGVEGFYYRYLLYIPIPEFLHEEENKYNVLYKHWDIIMESLDNFKSINLLVEFKPLYFIGRVYGWDGSWIAYSVTFKDTPEFWSLPMVNSFYNGVQPFLAVSEGEFVVLENDETKRSKESILNIMTKIHNRAEESGNILLKECRWLEITQDLSPNEDKYNRLDEMIEELLDDGKSIEVAPELAVALSLWKNNKKLKGIGSNLPSASLEDPETINSLDTPAEILRYMQDDLMKPSYRFSPNEIEYCKLPRK